MHGGGPRGAGAEEPEVYCTHENGIEGWKCCDCKGSIAKFNLSFDNNEGKTSHFTRIVFENNFLSDFKYEFRAQA